MKDAAISKQRKISENKSKVNKVSFKAFGSKKEVVEF